MSEVQNWVPVAEGSFSSAHRVGRRDDGSLSVQFLHSDAESAGAGVWREHDADSTAFYLKMADAVLTVFYGKGFTPQGAAPAAAVSINQAIALLVTAREGLPLVGTSPQAPKLFNTLDLLADALMDLPSLELIEVVDRSKELERRLRAVVAELRTLAG